MEDAQATTEEIFYGNLPQTRIGLPPGYPPNSPTGNQRVAKVTGTTWGGMKIGPAIALKVMAGDKFNVQVNSWYKLAKGQTIPAPSGIITELLAALNNAVGGISGSKATPTDLNSTGILLPGVNNFLTNQGNGSSNTAPRAYINWILFDEQFNYVSSNSGFEQVPAEAYYNNNNIPNNNTKLHVFNDLPISKSGFLYIYVSNETPNIDLFFDNLQVTHIRGQILETNEFYAGGLKMAGISYKSAGSFVSKNLFLGNELQKGEFSDGSGLELYDMQARNYDQQAVHFTGIDPLSDKFPGWSPYSYAFDNPIKFSDKTGMAPTDWYNDRNGFMQFDPNVKKQKDLGDRGTYVGATKTEKTKNGTASFRSDGSILYSNEHDAYDRIWKNTFERQKEQLGIIGNKSVLVLPDYLNNNTTGKTDDYGYLFKNGNLIDKLTGKTFETKGTIHAHMDGGGPSTYGFGGYGDLEVAAKLTPYKPVFVMQNEKQVTYANHCSVSFIISASNTSGISKDYNNYRLFNITNYTPQINVQSIRENQSLIKYVDTHNLRAMLNQ